LYIIFCIINPRFLYSPTRRSSDLVGTFMGTTESSDHNLYIVGDTMYQSNYVSGLRVVDISERLAPREIGYFDTVPHGENAPGFEDRKSTRLNSSHVKVSYAVFSLK